MSYSQPAGQQLTVDDLRVLMKELNNVRAKWYNIGVQLGVSVGALDAIEKQYSDPTDCLRRTLTIWLKSSTPMWSNIVDALSVVGEVRLATDLQHKYCSTQDIAATHQYAPPVPAVSPTQAHRTTPAPQSTVPLPQPLVFASLSSVPPQPYPSHSPPWSAPYYYPPPTSYPVSTPSLPPPTSCPVSTPSVPPPTSYPMSTPSLPPPTIYPVSTPSLPPSGATSTAMSLSVYSQLPHVTPGPTPSSSHTQPVQPVHLPANLPSDGVQSMSIQPDIAAGTCRFCCRYTDILLYCLFIGEFSLHQIFSQKFCFPSRRNFQFLIFAFIV